ncbi:MAG: hypothetical protein ACMUIL_03745 [bacterium]
MVFKQGAKEMLKRLTVVKWGIAILVVVASIGMIRIPVSQAQYWEALPPYNLLWPLWSPALSPVAATGMPVPVPLVSSLDNTTILPVQPALVWDPAQMYPWLMYNIPSAFGGGLAYFDAFYGLNPFPPPYLLDTAGAPLPIGLPVDFDLLPPTGIDDFAPYMLFGNFFFANHYGVDIASLLTAAQIWGFPPSGLPLF